MRLIPKAIDLILTMAYPFHYLSVNNTNSNQIYILSAFLFSFRAYISGASNFMMSRVPPYFENYHALCEYEAKCNACTKATQPKD